MDGTQSRALIAQRAPARRIALLRSREFGELAVCYFLVLLALWSSRPAQWIVAGVGFCWIMLVTLRSRPAAEELGLRITGMRRALWVVALAAIAAGLGIWISIRLHTFHAVFRHYAVEWGFLAYLVWALVQQFILQDFFLARLLRIVPTRALAVVAAGLLFALAHVPNPLLVIATAVWGGVACALFLRYRNLYVLGLAHAILGMCLAVAVPNTVHHHMHVGLGYLRWHVEQPPAQQRQTGPMMFAGAAYSHQRRQTSQSGR